MQAPRLIVTPRQDDILARLTTKREVNIPAEIRDLKDKITKAVAIEEEEVEFNNGSDMEWSLLDSDFFLNIQELSESFPMMDLRLDIRTRLSSQEFMTASSLISTAELDCLVRQYIHKLFHATTYPDETEQRLGLVDSMLAGVDFAVASTELSDTSQPTEPYPLSSEAPATTLLQVIEESI